MQESIPLNVRIIIDACRKAEKVISRAFWSTDPPQFFLKESDGSECTETDLRVADILRDSLNNAKPGCGFVCEEGGESSADSEFCFFIDPIDGTCNFIRKLPFFAVSVALAHTDARGNTELVAAVIYAPILREIYWAAKGRGAFVEVGNRQTSRIRVSRRRTLRKSVVDLVTAGTDNDGLRGVISHLQEQKVHLRMLGSASVSMAYVASGKCDVFFGGALKSWDIAAGTLVVQESGGLVTGRFGNNDCDSMFCDSGTLCTNGHMHGEFTGLLRKVGRW